MNPSEREAAAKLFGQIADWVQTEFSDANVTGFLGDDAQPAVLRIVIGGVEGAPEPGLHVLTPPSRHSHPVSGRKNDMLVHTHGGAVADHAHRIAHLGPMVKASDVRLPDDLAIAEVPA
jgi:hypothetical protein